MDRFKAPNVPKFDLTVPAPKFNPINNMPGALNWAQPEPNKFFPGGKVPTEQNMLGREIMQKQAQIQATQYSKGAGITGNNVGSFSFEGIKEKYTPTSYENLAVKMLTTKARDLKDAGTNFSNTTKSIVFKNCDINQHSLNEFNYIFTDCAAKLNYLELSDCNVPSAKTLFYGVSTANQIFKNGAYIVNLNLHGNKINDEDVKGVANYIHTGQAPHLKSLDLSGNLLTKVGEQSLISAVQSDKVKDLAITLHHAPYIKQGVDFLKKASSYIFTQHSKKQALTQDDVIAVYGDSQFGYCKEWAKKAVFGVSAGIVKEIATNPEAIAAVKAVSKSKKFDENKIIVGVALFIAGTKDAVKGGDVVNDLLFKCIGGINSHNAPNVEEYNMQLVGDVHDLQS